MSEERRGEPARGEAHRAGTAVWSGERWRRIRQWLRTADPLVVPGAERMPRVLGAR